MKKFYVLAIVALGAIVISSSCKKDEEDCVTECGKTYCESDFNDDKAKFEKEYPGEDYGTWSEAKAEAKAFVAEYGCEDLTD